MKHIIYLVLSFFLIIFLIACDKDSNNAEPVEYDGTTYILDHQGLPPPSNLPTDNILTEQGVQLGRMLFYEPALSGDGSQSCSSCHNQPDGFSDTLRLSLGIQELEGKRQAMPIFNLAWHSNQFFWDGRANLLRDQALLPIQDELEMDETLENVITKLEDMQMYKDQFMRTFGSEEITSEKMALAMEQFMLSIVSHDSKYDKYQAGLVQLTESEERGRALFETEYNPFFPETSGADCAHCHGGANFENDDYMNNGLDIDANFMDMGRAEVTMNPNDNAKFKVPSLRNIAVTAPYMHDGRFSTLEEVVEHYNSGIQESSTADFAILNTKETGLLLTEQDKQDLINFLHTLTDDTFLNNDDYKTPF
ncbi:MAG: cytochrome c peroxidase [Maribacter sp.]|jgi:cytochrome c peroxidase